MFVHMTKMKSFCTAIGGLGLTGIITWVELELKKASCMIDVENIPFAGLDEFFRLEEMIQSTVSHGWTVSMLGPHRARYLYERRS